MLSVWLPLNGNLDNQGLGDGAITANGATVSTSGKFGECYQFNGSSSISIAAVVIPPNTPEWSFCCWFCLPDTTATTATCLFSERSAVGDAGYTIFLYPNNGNILIDDGKRSIFNTMSLTANTWYHLVVLRTLGGKIDTVIGDAVVGSSSIGESTYIDQNNTYRVYINGKLKASRAADRLGEATTANTNGCLIGSALTTGGQGFKGKMNDVRIYTHAISRDEIYRLSQGLVLHYPLAMPQLSDLTDAEYDALRFDDDAVYDVSGFKNNASVRYGELTHSSDTPKYETCCVFDGATAITLEPDLYKRFIKCAKDELTASIWAYKDDWSESDGTTTQKWTLFSCQESGGFAIYESGNGAFIFVVGTGASSNSYIAKGTSTGYAGTLSPGWHMFTVTYNGLVGLGYIDGQLVTNTSAKYSTKTPMFYNAGTTTLHVGAEATANSTYQPMDNMYWNGKLSDFRVYTTALSADEVLKLYNGE